MDDKLKQWRISGKYLPPFLRDFHDQKDLFKNVHTFVDVKGHEYCKDIDWVAGHCYVIDIFLWYMARKGYTLQRSRQRLEFENVHDDTKARKQEEIEGVKQLIEQGKF